MPPDLMIAAIATILIALMAFGFPAIAIVLVRFLKLKERELALEMEYRQKSQHQNLAIDQRVQRLEDVLTSLDHDVRVRLGIESQSPTELASRPDLLEGPAAPNRQGAQSVDPTRTTARSGPGRTTA
jgi:hypothetical protein